MQVVLASNDPVVVGFAVALLRDAGLAPRVFDQNMSVLEGSIGILPRRIAVSDDEIETARTVLIAAGLGHELSPCEGTST
jgi:hypothetical protein